MSTGTAKLPFHEALAAAQEFAKLFEGMHDRWTIAGSIRRRKPQVGDVEHVVIPRMGECRVPGSIFPQTGSLLWAKVDELEAAGVIEKAVYTDGRNRWGENYRGMVYKGVRHEIFTAERINWGPILAIRTGPRDFSQTLMSRLNQGGRLKQQDGYLRYVGGPNDGAIRPCMDEREYLMLCIGRWIEPEDRL